ncbi:MAG: hypothetical protein P4M00_07470 [Azospirillaceae bacterium]|nr:hypothetical protein [Azospirillaceae bacterium]
MQNDKEAQTDNSATTADASGAAKGDKAASTTATAELPESLVPWLLKFTSVTLRIVNNALENANTAHTDSTGAKTIYGLDRGTRKFLDQLDLFLQSCTDAMSVSAGSGGVTATRSAVGSDSATSTVDVVA